MDLNLTDQLLISYSAFVGTGEKIIVQWGSISAVYILHDSVRRGKVNYTSLTEFGVPMKLVKLTETCFNETYSIKCKKLNIYLTPFLLFKTV
jgi:hypothetical protein